MKIYALHSAADNWNSGVSFLHTVLFHGQAQALPGRHGSMSHIIGESDMRPMELQVNGYCLPSIFKPLGTNNIVVAETIKNLLADQIKNCIFLPVKFVKVVNFQWSRELNVSSDYLSEVAEYGREMQIFSNLPHDFVVASQLQNYFELVPHNHYELIRKFRPTHKFFTKNYTGKPNERDLLPVSEQQFLEHSVSDPGYTVMNEVIFRAIYPQLESTFFGIKVFDFQNNTSSRFTKED